MSYIKTVIWISANVVWIVAISLASFYRLYDYVGSVLTLDDELLVYDFIVVGAGSSGSVLANRLSKNNRVLLLEAGGDPIFLHQYPGFNPHLLHDSSENWGYKTVPQEFSHFGFPNNVSLWPRGRALGGTSVLNGNKYARGHPKDYDNWAQVTKDESWKFENVLKYFKKSLVYNGRFKDNGIQYDNGPYGFLHVEDRTFRPLHKYFMEAAKEAGFLEIDTNGPQTIGFGSMDGTQKLGRRQDAYTAFLKPILHRDTLKILRYAQVMKVKLDKKNRAVGVWFQRHGKKVLARATKEVIVSAGAVDSPKLLMLSGIGPAEHLKSLKIKPRMNLPVGENLMDHLSVLIPGFKIDTPESFLLERDYALGTILSFVTEGKGAFTNPTADTTQGFFTTSVAKSTNWPNIQFYSHSVGNTADIVNSYCSMMGYDPERFGEFTKTLPVSDGFNLDLILVRPKSRGRVYLNDGDFSSSPKIDPRYLEVSEDVESLVEAIKFSVNMVMQSKSFQSINTTLVPTPFPSCAQFSFGSDSYWECYVRHMGMTLYHPAGTCKMGPRDDPTSVVDSSLRVIGTASLRVADASIMPVISNANTNAPCFMIGEKLADEIRQYWSEQTTYSRAFDYHFSQPLRCYYQRLY